MTDRPQHLAIPYEQISKEFRLYQKALEKNTANAVETIKALPEDVESHAAALERLKEAEGLLEAELERLEAYEAKQKKLISMVEARAENPPTQPIDLLTEYLYR